MKLIHLAKRQVEFCNLEKESKYNQSPRPILERVEQQVLTGMSGGTYLKMIPITDYDLSFLTGDTRPHLHK